MALPALAAMLLLGGSAANAQAQDPPGEVKQPAAAGGKKAGKTPTLPGVIEWKSRIFARAAYEDSTRSSLGVETRSETVRLSIPSARLGMKYQFLPWLSMVLEGDFTERALVKDAFAQAKTKRLRARAGQFKMPLSSITLESPWALPVARRGIIQGLLEERMSLVGRRPGFLVSVEGGGALDPELSLSAFQGAFLTGDADDTDLELLESGRDSQNLVARLAVTPGGQQLALHAERISTRGFMGHSRHFWAGGADAVLDQPFGIPGLRAWLEAIVGQTFYIDDLTSRDATLLSARGIVAWRWGGAGDGEGYLEPYVQAGVLDPDLDGARDRLLELSVGMNLGLWRMLRLTLQFEKARSQEQLPGQLFFGNLNLEQHQAALAQVGVAF